MNTRVVNKYGDIVSDTSGFFNTLRHEHQTCVKVELLDTQYNDIEGGTIFSKDVGNNLENVITDGNIDVDVTRGIRRTAELTILNPTADFTPVTEDFDPEGDWVGKIYINRVVRIWRGVYVGGQPQYVCVGTFMIDAANVIVEQNMSQVQLTLSDPWKKLQKSFFQNHNHYDIGTGYNHIIRDFLAASGADEPLDPIIDPLGNGRDTSITLKFAQGDSRGDALKKLSGDWDLDTYFNPMGRFISQDRTNPQDKDVVWQIYSSPDGDGTLISLNRSFNDDNLYNHVVVVATAHPKNIFRVTRKDTHPASKTSIDKIGDRVKIFESKKIGNMAEANRALNRLWNLRVQWGEQNDIEAICNPALEADDMIRLTEKNYAKVDGKYRLQAFNIPLVTSRQTLRLVNIIRGDDV